MYKRRSLFSSRQFGASPHRRLTNWFLLPQPCYCIRTKTVLQFFDPSWPSHMNRHVCLGIVTTFISMVGNQMQLWLEEINQLLQTTKLAMLLSRWPRPWKCIGHCRNRRSCQVHCSETKGRWPQPRNQASRVTEVVIHSPRSHNIALHCPTGLIEKHG